MKNPRTPLLSMLQRAYRIARESRKENTPSAAEILDMEREKWSRRQFIQNAGKAALVAGAVGLIPGCRPEDALIPNQEADEPLYNQGSNAKIAIVGAGMAGLHALHIFKKAGYNNVTVYEASNRVGGRIMTVQNVMAPGLTTEYGGEFIDSGHEDMLLLADELGLSLLDTQAPSELLLTKDVYFFNGQHYTLAQVIAEFENIAPAIEADYNATSDVIDYQHGNAFDQSLDNTSISEYLQNIGCTGWLKELLEVAYETEFGLSSCTQSCLNMIFLISTDTSGGTFEIFGESDERYKIAGGNQQIPSILAGMYCNHIETGRKLTAINRQSGQYKLYLTGYNQPKTFDYVIMTIPFSVLRDVDIMFNLPTWKKNSINQLQYGTNAKLMMGFNSAHWRTLGKVGYYFTDNGAQSGWDNSQLQGNTQAGMTVFTGGAIGTALGTGSVSSKVNQFLPKLEQMYPGITAKYNGNATRMHWPTFQYAKGSYPCYTTGQYTSIGDAEKVKVQRLYFAGDHCSFDFQGYMNAAALTGREAAEAIIEQIA